AYYSATPLIFITADRPARYRGTGAPQAIEQVGIFGVYAETDAATWSRTRALHINVEFDEPLIDDEAEGGLPARPLPFVPPPRTSGRAGGPVSFSKPLVIVGGLAAHQREHVRQFVNMLSAPVY